MKYITFKGDKIPDNCSNYTFYINTNAIIEIILDSNRSIIVIKTISAKYYIKVADGTVEDAVNLILESSPEDKTTIVEIK